MKLLSNGKMGGIYFSAIAEQVSICSQITFKFLVSYQSKVKFSITPLKTNNSNRTNKYNIYHNLFFICSESLISDLATGNA